MAFEPWSGLSPKWQVPCIGYLSMYECWRRITYMLRGSGATMIVKPLSLNLCVGMLFTVFPSPFARRPHLTYSNHSQYYYEG